MQKTLAPRPHTPDHAAIMAHDQAFIILFEQIAKGKPPGALERLRDMVFEKFSGAPVGHDDMLVLDHLDWMIARAGCEDRKVR